MSIILLIIRPNIVSILIGWDGLGLVSYCLVIYYQNLNSRNAGILTALINRIGDVIILLLIAWIINFGSWNFISFINKIITSPIIILIIIAGFTKRAQIPFSSWLPLSLIHIWMCFGVTKGFAGIKLSGSFNLYGSSMI